MKIIKSFISESIEETIKIAAALSKIFEPSDVVLLEGDLGSGKTFLVKELCKIWQTEDEAVSPSFSIINQYRGTLPVNHLDFYRIEDVSELDNLGWEEFLNMDAVTFIEWPQLIEKQLKLYYKIEIKFNGQKRKFTLKRFDPQDPCGVSDEK